MFQIQVSQNMLQVIKNQQDIVGNVHLGNKFVLVLFPEEASCDRVMLASLSINSWSSTVMEQIYKAR